MKLSYMLFYFTLITGIIATTGSLTFSDQIISDCANNDWCISFKDMIASLDGHDGTHDVTIHYDASEPGEDGTSKYYRVSLRDHETCYKPVVSGSGIEIPSTYVEGKIPYSAYKDDDDAGNKAGFMSVGLDIDTTALENSALTSSTNGNKIDMRFCVKIDLVSKIGSQIVPVSTKKTKIVLNINQSQDFASVQIVAAEEVVEEETEDVLVDYNLQACVCAAGDSDLSADGSCLLNYVGLQPASYFKLCVKSLDSEVKVTSLKDISFKAKASGAPDAPDVVEVVIINSSGEGVGPASDPVCDPNTGVCVVSALTYGIMYEHNDGTTNIDISSWGRMEGTSILEFNDLTTASNSPTATTSDYPTAIASDSPTSSSACLVSGTMTGAEATTACTGKNCCTGWQACYWSSKLEICLAEGTCKGTDACKLSTIITEGASFIVGTNSCSGSYSCNGLKMPSSIGDQSCKGNYSCQSRSGDVSYNIGDGSCIAGKPCGDLRIRGEVGNNSCLGDQACNFQTGSVGDNSCLFYVACYQHKGDVGDNQFQNLRRLRSSPSNQYKKTSNMKALPSPGSTHELIKVESTSFSAVAQRQTEDDRQKVNKFNVSMGLASSVSGCSGIHDTIKNIIPELFLIV